MGLGSVRQYGFDAADRLTTQIEYVSSSPIMTFIDSYDPVGNRIGRLQNGIAFTWVYDSDYRLTGQQNAGGCATFQYEAAYVYGSYNPVSQIDPSGLQTSNNPRLQCPPGNEPIPAPWWGPILDPFHDNCYGCWGFRPIRRKPQRKGVGCSSGGQQCSNMCNNLARNRWEPTGQSYNVAAMCAACCIETLKIFKNWCKDISCCYQKCSSMAISPTKPGAHSGLLPCDCSS